MKTKALMYCSRGDRNSGYLHRAIEIARQLSETNDVTLLIDDNKFLPADVPESIQLVCLPNSGAEIESQGKAGDSGSFNKVVIARRDTILGEFERLKPRIVVIDGFPFSQQQRRGELLPLIERARNGIYGESLVVCTTDSIVIDEQMGGECRADLAAAVLDKYFDLIIVQSDPVFARLEEFFRSRITLHTPAYHTGFVMSERSEPARPRDDAGADSILVSAGDGQHGGALFRAAIESQRVLWPLVARPMQLIAGQRLPKVEYQELLDRAKAMPGILITRHVDNLTAEMSRACCSVSQCDYAVALAAISTRTPSLFVPCLGSQRQEQVVRAQRLVCWGAGRLLLPQHLNSASLTNEINRLPQFPVHRIRFETNGAANAANMIDRVLHCHDAGSQSLHFAAPGPCPN